MKPDALQHFAGFERVVMQLGGKAVVNVQPGRSVRLREFGQTEMRCHLSRYLTREKTIAAAAHTPIPRLTH